VQPQPGTVLDGRYRVDALIGTGGMSRVYAAHDLTLGRRVAVKIVTAVDESTHAEERVRIETAALAALTHPNLVTLHDAQLAGPGPRYLVMEHVDGPSLATRLRDGALTPDEVARIAGELAEALTVVHAGAVVHRDIKPSNILLAPGATPSRPPRAKLADFGIAHLLGSDRITQPGMLIGTAAYLAPEVALGHAPAPASDVYALGLVLLEALTGMRAFPRAEGAAQVFARLAQDPVIPDTLPPLWAELLPAMLRRDPAGRPSAAAIADTLVVSHRTTSDDPTAVLASPALPAAAAARLGARPVARARWWRRVPVLVAAGAVALAVVVALGVASSGLAGTPAVERTPEPTAPSEIAPAQSPVPEQSAPASDDTTVSNPGQQPAPQKDKDKGKDNNGPGNNNGNGNGNGPGKGGG